MQSTHTTCRKEDTYLLFTDEADSDDHSDRASLSSKLYQNMREPPIDLKRPQIQRISGLHLALIQEGNELKLLVIQ